jgi:hypothetical protein
MEQHYRKQKAKYLIKRRPTCFDNKVDLIMFEDDNLSTATEIDHTFDDVPL